LTQHQKIPFSSITKLSKVTGKSNGRFVEQFLNGGKKQHAAVKLVSNLNLLIGDSQTPLFY
jgi:hypothetical protein